MKISNTQHVRKKGPGQGKARKNPRMKRTHLDNSWKPVKVKNQIIGYKKGKTLIRSNGSRYGRERPAKIEELEWVLKNYPLNPVYEGGNFAYKIDDILETGRPYHLFGNFATVSHVFNIETGDARLYNRLKRQIRANQKTTEYKRFK